MTTSCKLLLTVATLFAASGVAAADCAAGQPVEVRWHAAHSPEPVQRGNNRRFLLFMRVCDPQLAPVYVIAESKDGVAGPTVTIDGTTGIQAGLSLPRSRRRSLAGLEAVRAFPVKELTELAVVVAPPRDAALGVVHARVTVSYQVATQDRLYPPAQHRFELPLLVTDEPEYPLPIPLLLVLGFILLPVYLLYCGTLAWIIGPCGS